MIEEKANDNIFEEIKSKITICDELEKRGFSLYPQGTKRMKCLCPFHDDHNPSMVIYLDDKSGWESYHCFVCKASGDIINLVKGMDNLDTSGALKYFAKEYDIKILKYKKNANVEDVLNGSPQKRRCKKSRFTYMMEISDFIREFFKNSSDKNESFEKMKKYMKNIDDAAYNDDISTLCLYRDIIEEAIESLDKNDILKKMRRECVECKKCDLRKGCMSPVFGFGNINSGSFLIFDSPEMEDDKLRESFSGKSGKFIKDLLKSIGIDESKYWLTNCVCCFSQKKKQNYNEDAKICIKSHLSKQIEIGSPSKIMLIGNSVKNMLFPSLSEKKISDLLIEKMPAKIFNHKCKVSFSMSPSFFFKSPEHSKNIIFKKFLNIMENFFEVKK